jgi:hypothetical protein
MRNNVGHPDLYILIEKRVIEIMRPPGGWIMQDDYRSGRHAVPGYRVPKTQNGIDGAGHGEHFLYGMYECKPPDRIMFPWPVDSASLHAGCIPWGMELYSLIDVVSCGNMRRAPCSTS